jgi:hypothetical protein
MNDEIAKAIIELVGQGGAEASSIARLYIWLNSSLLSGALFVISIIVFYLGASKIAGRIWDANKDMDN